MPLSKIEWTGDQCGWALWHITENEEMLLSGEPPPEDIIYAPRRLEWLAGRLLLQELVEKSGLRYRGVGKDEYGKPSLTGQLHHISLSHSFPYVAAQIDVRLPVGIDIEQPRPKLLRIAHRIYAPAEVEDAGDDVVKHCIYWCAKEALYKIYGKKGLSFAHHVAVDPFTLQRSGVLTGHIKKDETVELHALIYTVFDEFVLVRTASPQKT